MSNMSGAMLARDFLAELPEEVAEIVGLVLPAVRSDMLLGPGEQDFAKRMIFELSLERGRTEFAIGVLAVATYINSCR